MHIRMHSNSCVYEIFVSENICVFMCVHICVHVCTSICVFMCVHMFVHVCVYTDECMGAMGRV